MRRPDLGGTYAVVTLFGALLPCAVNASHFGRRDTIHSVEKVHVTVQHLGRREERCPAGNFLCPASMSGGCCPDSYGCATDHCYATTAGGRTCGGKKGWYGCGLDTGGGCCPEGYICQVNQGCVPPAGATYTLPCPTGFSMCASSLGGGCCVSGMGCGQNLCYSTQPIEFTFTRTFPVTMSHGVVVTTTSTVTTVSTPQPPAAIPSDTQQGIAKLFVTALPKVEPSDVPSEGSSGGLTTAQIGGIAGGVGALLLIVLAVAFFIVKRLKQTEKAVEESHRGSSSADRTMRSKQGMTQYPIGHHHYPRPTASQLDAMEYDDLLQSNASTAPTPMNAASRVSSEMTPSSRPTPHISSSPDIRHPSMDSAAGYFDLPPRSQSNPNGRHSAQMSVGVRSSIDSQATVAGAGAGVMAMAAQQDKSRRHHSSSNASELSWASELPASGLGSPGLPAELGSTTQIPELQGSTADDNGGGSSIAQSRRRSAGSVGGPMGAVSRPPTMYQRGGGGGNGGASSSGGAQQQQHTHHQLDVVNESTEIMHGYYGPQEHAGQTHAGLHMGHDISSPLATHFQGQENFYPQTSGGSSSDNTSGPGRTS